MTNWRPAISGRKGPRYRAIADCLAEDVQRGHLQAGDRLPPQREMAGLLGLTVGTVTRAYAEAERRGFVRAEVGRGTFVRELGGSRADGVAAQAEPDAAPVDLGMNLPLYAEDPDLGAALRRLAEQRHVNDLLRYQPGTWTERHRRAGADWIARHGLEVSSQQVVITAGAQHAITVLLGTLCRPGDRVLCEPLTYPGLKTVASLLGLELAVVKTDAEGIEPDALAEACERTRARVLYTLPTLHNPTTTTLGEERRRALAKAARRCELNVVEDDAHGLLLGDAPPPLATCAPERTFYITSTSKVLAGGLRVAFVAVPPGFVERLAFAVAASLWVTPPLTVELAANWIEDGTAERVVARKRDEAAVRQRIAATFLAAASVRSAPTSYFLWLELPPPWSAAGFAAAARSRGVIVAPADAFAVGLAPHPRGVRVSLSAPPDRAALERGLATLAAVLAEGPAPAAVMV